MNKSIGDDQEKSVKEWEKKTVRKISSYKALFFLLDTAKKFDCSEIF